MGKAKRVIPSHLPEKLKKLRFHLKLSLAGMVGALEIELIKLGYDEFNLYPGYVTEFEQGKREPSLPVLLAYARVSKINLELLIDDKSDVPF